MYIYIYIYIIELIETLTERNIKIQNIASILFFKLILYFLFIHRYQQN